MKAVKRNKKRKREVQVKKQKGKLGSQNEKKKR